MPADTESPRLRCRAATRYKRCASRTDCGELLNHLDLQGRTLAEMTIRVGGRVAPSRTAAIGGTNRLAHDRVHVR